MMTRARSAETADTAAINPILSLDGGCDGISYSSTLASKLLLSNSL